MEQQTCPFCNTQIPLNVYFCPNCGKKIKEPPLSTTIGKQIEIYLICIFLPPFGLIPAIKYIRQKDPKAKNIGIIALILTGICTIVNFWLVFTLLNNINSQINNQLNTINNLGY